MVGFGIGGAVRAQKKMRMRQGGSGTLSLGGGRLVHPTPSLVVPLIDHASVRSVEAPSLPPPRSRSSFSVRELGTHRLCGCASCVPSRAGNGQAHRQPPAGTLSVSPARSLVEEKGADRGVTLKAIASTSSYFSSTSMRTRQNLSHALSHGDAGDCCSCGSDASSRADDESARVGEFISRMTGLRAASRWLGRRELGVVIVCGVLLVIQAVASFCAGFLVRGGAQAMAASNQSIATSLQAMSNIMGNCCLALISIPAIEKTILDIARFNLNVSMMMTVSALASGILGNPAEGALLLLLFRSAHILETYLVAKLDKDIGSAANQVQPQVALKVVKGNGGKQPPGSGGGEEVESVSVSTLKIGDTIVVRQGQVAPIDGVMLKGACSLDVEHLTGEAMPIRVASGDAVPAGGVVTDGEIRLRVLRLHEDSTIARIKNLTESAASQRPTVQVWLDNVTNTYSKGVLASAFVAFVLLTLLPGISGLEAARRALGYLVVASPCALAAAPLCYAAALSSCAKQGILVRSGRVLDAIAECDTVAFDKTGTLTSGDLVLEHSQCWKEDENWNTRIATVIGAVLERGIVHPVARALQKDYEKIIDEETSGGGTGKADDNDNSMRGGVGAHHHQYNLEKDLKFSDIQVVAGEGVSAKVQLPGSQVLEKARIGRSSFALEGVHGEEAGGGGMESPQGNVVLSVGTSKVCTFSFRDSVRASSSATIQLIKSNLGLDTAMLSGDVRSSATSTASQVGIDEESVFAGLSPADKLEKVVSLQSSGKNVLMVGEGVNDAPALAASTVGVTLSERASAASVEAADVLLVRDDIRSVAFVISMAKRAVWCVRCCLGVASVSLVGAAYASLVGALPLWLLVMVHEGGTLLVCATAVYNSRIKLKEAVASE